MIFLYLYVIRNIKVRVAALSIERIYIGPKKDRSGFFHAFFFPPKNLAYNYPS